jgi:hypothetical protein
VNVDAPPFFAGVGPCRHIGVIGVVYELRHVIAFVRDVIAEISVDQSWFPWQQTYEIQVLKAWARTIHEDKIAPEDPFGYEYMIDALQAHCITGYRRQSRLHLMNVQAQRTS